MRILRPNLRRAIEPPPVATVVTTISAVPAHVAINDSIPARFRRKQINPAETIPPRKDASTTVKAKITWLPLVSQIAGLVRMRPASDFIALS